MPPRVIVVGGGLGGLTTAIALRQADIDTRVFERAPQLVEVGAGIHMWMNGMQALRRLGLDERVEQLGFEIERMQFLDSRGRLLADWPMRDSARALGAPTLGIARPVLQRVLFEAIDDGVLQLGAECKGFVQNAEGVTVRFTDGREERGDLLVGADGRESVLRAQLLGWQKPRYAGYTTWRALLPSRHDLSPPGIFRVWWGRASKFVTYHVGDGIPYWEAIAVAPEGERDEEGGRRAAVLSQFAEYPDPVAAIVEATDERAIVRVDMYDRDPVKRWGEGRVTLLGDAAHPMTQGQGQGASQSLEDALVLARCLREESDVVAALRAYEARRIPRTGQYVMLSRRVGTLEQWRNPVARALRNSGFRLANGLMLKQTMKRMAYEL